MCNRKLLRNVPITQNVDKIKKYIRPCGKTYQIYSNTKGVQNYDHHIKRRIKKRVFRSKSVIDIAFMTSAKVLHVLHVPEVNGEVVNLRTVLDSDCELNILTAKDEKGLKFFVTQHLMFLRRLYRTYIRKQRLLSDRLLIQDFIMISITYRSHVRIWTQLRKK